MPSKDMIAKLFSKTTSSEIKASLKKITFKNSSRKKIAFLMAFQKLGFDTYEIAKLMTEKDDKELSVRKFINQNKHRWLSSGTLDEIKKLRHINNFRDDIIETIIENIELNHNYN